MRGEFVAATCEFIDQEWVSLAGIGIGGDGCDQTMAIERTQNPEYPDAVSVFEESVGAGVGIEISHRAVEAGIAMRSCRRIDLKAFEVDKNAERDSRTVRQMPRIPGGLRRVPVE